MSAESNQPNWYLSDGRSEIGPLSEVELRTRLVKSDATQLSQMRVRQGQSGWHAATDVLAKFRRLAENGVYFKRGGELTGPFTTQRAVELLRGEAESPESFAQLKVRIGRDQGWQPAADFLRGMSGIGSKQIDATPNANGDVDASTPLVVATLIDEPLSMFKATLVDEPQPRAVPRVQSATGIYDTVSQATPNQAAPGGQLSPRATASTLGPGVRPGQPNFGDARTEPRSAGRGWGLWIALGISVFIVLLVVGGVGWFLIDRWTTDAGAVAGSPDKTTAGPTVSAANRPAGKPPVVSTGMLFRPSFETAEGTVEAGTAFAARVPGSQRPIIISALHLFGPAGGLDRNILPGRLPAVWRETQLLDCVTQRQLGPQPGRPLSLLGTRPLPEPSSMGDVVAYMPHEKGILHPWALAVEPAEPGERVWLVSEVLSGTSLTHAAVVEGMEDGWLIYRFDDATIELRATSGAPVVNKDHEVVAVNAGGGEQDGQVFGVGTPTQKFLEPLAKAAGLR
jgi:hypothetical protein